MNERRKFIRVDIKKLTSIVKNHTGVYELIPKDAKSIPTLINVKDISSGGLRIESKYEILEGVMLELSIPKVKNLDATVIFCEVIRSEFKDGEYSYYTALRFKTPNTEYVKQLIDLIGVEQETLIDKSQKLNSSLDKDKIIEAQAELIKSLKKQVKEWKDWKASSKQRHAKGKAKADLAIAKHKNTLRIKTTRKRKSDAKMA
jgi:hypothetical protein